MSNTIIILKSEEGGDIVGRPSIFSREYKRRMRMRKIRIGFLVLAIIVSSAAFLSKDITRNWLEKNIGNLSMKNENFKGLLSHWDKKETDAQVQKDNPEPPPEQVKPVDKTQEETASEKYYDVKLSNDVAVKAIYEEKAEGKILKGLSEDNIYYNISPSGKNMVIFNDKTQDIFLVDSNGAVSDVTMKRYISKNYGTTYVKDQYLQGHPQYVWTSSPKFIDDNSIVFISQVPYFGSQDNYVWIINLQAQADNTGARFKCLYDAVKGMNIKVGKLTETGLELDVDGKQLVLGPSGEIKK